MPDDPIHERRPPALQRDAVQPAPVENVPFGPAAATSGGGRTERQDRASGPRPAQPAPSAILPALGGGRPLYSRAEIARATPLAERVDGFALPDWTTPDYCVRTVDALGQSRAVGGFVISRTPDGDLLSVVRFGPGLPHPHADSACAASGACARDMTVIGSADPRMRNVILEMLDLTRPPIRP